MDSNKFGRVGIFPDKDGELCVNFRKGDKGVCLFRVLPESAQGENFKSFQIKDFIDYAFVWLASIEQWQELSRASDIAEKSGQVLTVGKKSEIYIAHSPLLRLDMEAYNLIKQDGSIDYDQLAKIYQEIGKLWDYYPEVEPEKGLFHALYKNGMPLDKIIESLVRSNKNEQFFQKIETQVFKKTKDKRKVTKISRKKSRRSRKR